MGFLKKKSSSSTQTDIAEQTLQKVVKLSYIQSLAINGSIIDPRSLVETKGSKIDVQGSEDTKRNAIEEINHKLGDSGSAILGHTIGGGIGAIASLFGGKKVTTDIAASVEDTGWTLVKTWLQPEFDVIRYAIGIKELSVSQFTYVPVSEFISKSWQSPKGIIKVTLLVDQFIPPQFPPGSYIEYYIKPDLKELDWIRINPLGVPSQFTDAGDIIPRIITFNVERSISSHIEESYINTAEPVKSIRLKAVLRRPNEMMSYSPVLRSYRLSFSLWNGL